MAVSHFTGKDILRLAEAIKEWKLEDVLIDHIEEYECCYSKKIGEVSIQGPEILLPDKVDMFGDQVYEFEVWDIYVCPDEVVVDHHFRTTEGDERWPDGTPRH